MNSSSVEPATPVSSPPAESMVALLRRIRDQISLDIQDMTTEELMAYIQARLNPSPPPPPSPAAPPATT